MIKAETQKFNVPFKTYLHCLLAALFFDWLLLSIYLELILFDIRVFLQGI